VGAQAAAGGGLSARPAGSDGGKEGIRLTEGQMPSHTHGVSDPGHAHGPGQGGVTFIVGGVTGAAANISQGGRSFEIAGTTSQNTTGIGINPAGSGRDIDIMPPYLALLFCRKN
jgi:microcystin-dependent protein